MFAASSRAVAASDLRELTAAEVSQAVLGEVAGRSPASVRRYGCALRAFLRFCYLAGLIETDLSAAALPVTGRRRSLLPQGISRAQARALLRACDRRRALGRRDYAVIVLLLRLGLRAGEVAALRLDDIDWRAGRAHGARQGRTAWTGCRCRSMSGEAIACLSAAGPAAQRRAREVFVRAVAPPVGADPPGRVVHRAARRARGPGWQRCGAHRLRHTVACEMVRAGVPLAEIGQVLRHRCLQHRGLRPGRCRPAAALVARPWPDGARIDERAGRPRGGLPAAAPRAGLQARARTVRCCRSWSPTWRRPARARSPSTWRSPGPGCRRRIKPITGRSGSARRAGSPATCRRSTRRPRSRRPGCSPSRGGDRRPTCIHQTTSSGCWSATRRLRPPLRAATYEALFGLLAATGMRLGEALALTRDDVDLDDGRASRSGTRSSTAPGWCRCTRRSPRRCAATPPTRDRLCPHAALDRVLRLVQRRHAPASARRHRTFRADHHRPRVCAPATVRPRVHDLRHSFAVRTLIDWQRDGRGRRRAHAAGAVHLSRARRARPTPTGTCPRRRS